jgi:hypothetical protein
MRGGKRGRDVVFQDCNPGNQALARHRRSTVTTQRGPQTHASLLDKYPEGVRERSQHGLLPLQMAYKGLPNMKDAPVAVITALTAADPMAADVKRGM